MLYVGGLWKGTTGLGRKNAFEALGYKVITFDTERYVRKGNKIMLYLTHKLSWGPAIRSLNRDLVEFIKDLEYDMVWVSKGIWIYPDTVEALKQKGRARVVHYTPDPAIVFHQTRHFMRCITLYDVLFTTFSYEIPYYHKHGARRVVYAHKGTNLNLLKPYDVSGADYDNLRSDVCFIGHTEPHYYYRLKAVSRVVNNLAVWGDRWGRKTLFHPWLKKAFRGGGIWGIEYAQAICCAKIGLGLLSKLVPGGAQVTQRSVEIPACGTFFLAERTDEHLELFEEGKEAEFFSSDEELQDKIKYYLKYPKEREKIAKAGLKRCLTSGYDNETCMRRCLEESLRG
jgi:spore maturation protein CgeB